MGLLVSGGSMASLTCLAAARHRAASRDGWDVRADGVGARPAPLVLYLSEEGHSCIRKAAEVLGLGADSRADRARRRRLPDGRRGAPRRRRRGPRGRAPPVLRGGQRGDGQHGRDRSARRAGRPLRRPRASGSTSTAPTARSAPRIPRSRRATPASSAPTHSPSIRTSGSPCRSSAGAPSSATAACSGTTFSLVATVSPHRGRQGLRRPALVLGVRVPADPRLPGPQAVDDPSAPRPRRRGRTGPPSVALAQRLAWAVDAAPDLERVAPARAFGGVLPLAPRIWGDARASTPSTSSWWSGPGQGQAFLTGTVLRGRFALRACVLHYGTTAADVDALIDTVRETGARLVSRS